MALDVSKAGSTAAECELLVDALERARALTLALVAHLDDEQLERVHSPIMSPLVWDLGHIAAYEDLWIAHRLGGLDLLREDLASAYDAFETPRAIRGEIEVLGSHDAREYAAAVRERSIGVLTGDGAADGTIAEMVVRHEHQHRETMRQTLAIAGLLGPGEGVLAPPEGTQAWVDVPAGPFAMGSPAEGFAYDNERPRHERHTAAFRIARLPVSNEEWLRFSEHGGYEDREWWSPDGWAWRQEHAIRHHQSIDEGHPRAPACHVSWYEADAFARARGARLPSEAEWEKAATLGAGGAGVLDARGLVWEWTQSAFGGYPGFVAHPYREYSEVFFGGDYRVLRGASWATDPRVASPRFRNWDLPQRRQIFSGVRLACAAA
ncbi:MAG TPA: SUMF1/EgtB/PvdO family nonheme iron enzyme [Solirubrobacteraceae bacterium]|nr:SUMF1/EgtB/PvdO family nonheme iron enzyme [Solirubrobacteraceae bacterium]